ncbi:RCKP-type rubredoxin-like domain-containing protein [Candidatus Zixiibacteriota bacterium]
MALWICAKCGYKVEGRCRPPQCPACKATKDQFKKG